MASNTRRILGVALRDKQSIHIALTGVYGLGRFMAKTVCAKLGLNPMTRIKDIHPTMLHTIGKTVESEYVVQNDLKDQMKSDIMRLVNMRCYRGIRHAQGLPLRGQRTSTNGKTAKKMAGRRANLLGIKYPAIGRSKKQKGKK
mmetsp:Transcript_30107/g.58049  ORF Transcript_30107/g.58049 Transcript_30107/m.58049 type:complete len:143 (+) Transcript_30107:2-430(+)